MQTVKREGAGIGSSVISGKNGSQCFMMAYEDDTGREKLIVVGTGEFIDYLTKEAQLQNKPAKASGPGDARFAFIEFLARDWEQMKFE